MVVVGKKIGGDGLGGGLTTLGIGGGGNGAMVGLSALEGGGGGGNVRATAGGGGGGIGRDMLLFGLACGVKTGGKLTRGEGGGPPV